MNDAIKNLVKAILVPIVAAALAVGGAKYFGPDFAKEVCANAQQAPAPAAQK